MMLTLQGEQETAETMEMISAAESLQSACMVNPLGTSYQTASSLPSVPREPAVARRAFAAAPVQFAPGQLAHAGAPAPPQVPLAVAPQPPAERVSALRNLGAK